jgi:TonB family protein
VLPQPFRTGFFLAALLGILLLTRAAGAQSDGTADIDFDIPAQPLAGALDAYSLATGIVAVYHGELAIGRQSSRVRGRYAAETALRILLGDSGLTVQYTSQNAFVLVPASGESPVVRIPSTIGFGALATQNAVEQRYSGLVQSGIKRSLCAKPQTRPGDYRLAMTFRIGPSGEITSLKLLNSTGDRERDAAIVEALQELRSVGAPPPPSMAQPFTMIVLPRSSGGVVDCALPEGGRRNG